MEPPRAARRPVTRVRHGQTTVDEFCWLSERDDEAVLAYLEAENTYTQAVTAHLADLRETIFEEIRSRVQETDLSAPARRGRFWYGHRTEEGGQYPIFVRWPDRNGQPGRGEEVVIDQNDLAGDHDFCALGLLKISPDQRLVAYAVDYSGDEEHELRFRDLGAGTDLADRLAGVYYGGAWSADGGSFFYTTVDAVHRPYRLFRHRLGADQSEDVLVFQEDDEHFFVEVTATRDDEYVLVLLESSTTSECRFVPATAPERAPQVLIPRCPGVRYLAEHHHGRWLVVSDAGAPNGRLIAIDPAETGEPVEIIAHSPDVKLGRVLPFDRHVVVLGRREGNPMITVIPNEGPAFDVGFEEPGYRIGPGENLDYRTNRFRFTYESLLTPRRVIDVDLDDGEQTVVKETTVPNYDSTAYAQERVWCPVGAVAIPITIAYRRRSTRPAPVLLYGYGAYESVLDPWFDPALFSLLDRGVVYAIAHVRGGGEMGRLWHLDGRMEHKSNTFTDFIACAEHLLSTGVARPGQIAARGLSAGGLLMGAVTTMRPDLWAAVVAEVPFVDVINTMSDPSIPLTVIEWEEWGNPHVAEQHEWMAAYSPYERTVPAEYPAVLATAGLNDSRVAFWEPAKWVARLRTVNRGSRPILLRTELGVGHGGPSGRYDAWRDEAFVLGFILDQLDPGNVKLAGTVKAAP